MAQGARIAGRRIACLLVKELPLAAMVRANPELRAAAFALSIGKGPRAPLGFVSAAARHAGVIPGMTVAQASAVAPDLTVFARDSALEQAAADALLDVAESFSPIVEAGDPGRVYLDLAGLRGLYGAEDDMAAELARRVRQVGMEADIGIGVNKDIAYLAARCGGIRVIDTGRENEFLQWIPLELLGLEPDVELQLERLGIRRLGELTRLDARELGSRMGAGAVELMRLVRGQTGGPLIARRPGEVFTEKTELEYTIELLEPLGFILRGMLERLAARLKLRGLIAGDLTLSLEMTGHRRDERRVSVAAATNEVRSLLTLLLLDLEKSPPPEGVEAVQLSAQARVPRPAQDDMFLPPAPAPERLQTTLARLAALCGPDHVGTLLPANSHRPDATERVDFAPPAPATASPQPERNGHTVSRIVLRAIRPAQEVEVMSSRGMPEFVRGRQICARVVSIAGPWRRQGEWWKAALDSGHRNGNGAAADTSRCVLPGGFANDYYEMALDDGGVYRVFRDLRSDRWFVDGIYD
ncbi:MAG TPA: DNA polymerase Y family protein [Candidatus Binataceae bacterium]|nr:DNA polymerase Y family protein [Candidatus Binataceae bacterium]